jgi:hypothetical protein
MATTAGLPRSDGAHIIPDVASGLTTIIRQISAGLGQNDVALMGRSPAG